MRGAKGTHGARWIVATTLVALALGAGTGCNSGRRSGGAAAAAAVTSSAAPITSGLGSITSGTAPVGTGTAPVTSGVVSPPAGRAGGAPSVALTPVAAPVVSSLVVVDFALTDADADPATLDVRFSLDDGATWAAARDAGAAHGSAGTQALASAPGGAPHRFVWDAGHDAGRTYRAFVRLRLTATDVDGAGTPAETATFLLDATTAPDRLVTLGVPVDPAGADRPIAYTVSPTGGLTYRSTQPTASGGRGRQMSSASGVVMLPRGDAVVMSHNDSAHLSLFAVTPTGDLSLVGGTIATTGRPTTLAVHPSGKFIYTTTGDRLEAFGFDAAGVLLPLPGSPYTIGSSPRGLVCDPRGDALYTGHMFGTDAGVQVHRLDRATGVPTLASALPLGQLGSRPGKTLAVDPRGRFLYCLDLDRGLFVASIDPQTRALTLVQGLAPRALGGFALGLTLSTRGDALYATVQGVGLLGFRVDPATSALTAAQTAPLTNVGGTTLYLHTDAADRHLFATSRDDDTLRVYAIDPVTKALAEVAGSPRFDYSFGVVVGPLLTFPAAGP